MAKIVTRVEKITPRKAASYLLLNGRNRPIRRGYVALLARAMKAGEWLLTGQGIQFDTQGELCDGQHRLLAVIESQCTIESNVTRGLPVRAMEVIDSGRARSISDALTIGGLETSSLEVAIGRRMMYGLDGSMTDPTRGQLIAFVEKHIDAIRFAEKFPGDAGMFRHAAIRAVVARAYYTTNHKRLAEFLRVLASGIMTGPGDAGAVLLRNLVIRRRGKRSPKPLNLEFYAKTEMALNAFLAHDEIKYLAASKDELFPLP